jgi:hypothetical protein
MRAGTVRILATVVIGCLASAGLQVTPAKAQPPASDVLARQVGPHRFLTAPGTPTPFLSTFLRVSVGAAVVSGMEIGLYNFEDPPQLIASKQTDLMYLAEDFEFQQRVGRDVAVRLLLTGSGRVGTETAALLSEGISAIAGWGAGGTVRLTERPNFRLAASLDAFGNTLTLVSPRSFVEDVLANGLSDTTNSLVDDSSNLRVTTGLRAAWGHSQTTGSQLYADIGFQEPYNEGEDTDVYWQAGGAVSLDMHERWKPDLGFHLSATYRSRYSRNEDLGGGGWTTGLGIYYTGRSELTLGVQTFYTRLQQRTIDNEIGAFGFNFTLRYDFS